MQNIVKVLSAFIHSCLMFVFGENKEMVGPNGVFDLDPI